MFCSNCGREISYEAKFCSYCGTAQVEGGKNLPKKMVAIVLISISVLALLGLVLFFFFR